MLLAVIWLKMTQCGKNAKLAGGGYRFKIHSYQKFLKNI
jgi:hypothetical protein